jgi:cation transport ATPase
MASGQHRDGVTLLRDDPACSCAPPDSASVWSWTRIVLGAVLAVNSMALALALNTVNGSPEQLIPREQQGVQIALLALTAVVAVLVGGPLLRGALTAIQQRRLAVELLFLLTLSGAAGVSIQSLWAGSGPVYFEVLSILLVVYAFGHQLNAPPNSGRSRQSKITARRRARRGFCGAPGR